MSKSRKKKRNRSGRARNERPRGAPPSEPKHGKSSRWRLVILVGLAGLALASGLGIYARFGTSPDVPRPRALAEMEPQVRLTIEEHREAVLAEPDSSEAWGRLGMVFQAHGMEAEAIPCYQKAVELDPRGYRWHYLLAHALKDSSADAAGDPSDEQGEPTRVERALEHATRASELRPDYAPAYLLRGQLLEQENRLDEAVEQYRKAVAVDPSCTPAQFGLGRLYFTRGEVEASRRHLELAAEQNPDAGNVRGFLARVYRRLGDADRATEEARLAAELTGNVTLDDPIYFEMSGEAVSSVALLDRALQVSEAGDHARAEALYRELIEIRPEDADMRARLGDALALQDKLEAAKEQYRAALELNPRHPAALYGLGNMLNYERRYEDAERRYRESLEARPDHVPSLLNLGGILAFEGKLDEAASLFEKALALDPGNFGAHRQLGEIALEKGDAPAAVEHFEQALEARPEAGPLHLQLAVALATSGDFGAAWEHVQTARELGQEIPPELMEALQKRLPPGASR